MVDVHTHLPARVETFDAAKQSCSVQVETRQARYEEDGSRVPERLPVINDVPVIFSGAGGYRTTYPLQRGDKVWLEVGECALNLWKARGGDVDPADDRRMDLSDAVAVIGLRDFAHPWASCPTDRMTVGADTGAQIHITQIKINVGGDSAQPTYRAPPFQTALSTLLTAIGTAIGSSGTPAGAAAAAATLTGAITTFLTAASAAQTQIAQVA